MALDIDSLAPEEWVIVIGESLVKRDLVSLCGRLGVDYPGRRLESLGEVTLARALAGIVLDEPGPGRDFILERLRTSNQMLSDHAREMTVERLKDALVRPSAWPQSASPGRILWVLASDSRGAVRKLASSFSRMTVETAVDLLAERPAVSTRAPVLRDAVAEMKDATEKLTELASKERRRAERDSRRIRDLEGQVTELRKQVAERDQKLAARKAELEAAQEETRKATQETESIRARLKAQPPGSWESERRRLEHEVKSLTSKLEEERAAAQAATRQAQQQIRDLEAASRTETASLHAELLTARKELGWLRDRMKTPVAPPVPVRRDPQRLAVFAEAQSLYYLAIARHSRVDYRRILERALEGGGQLGRALVYMVEVPGTNPSGFKQVLQSQGFQVRSKPGRSAGVWTSGLEADLRDAARTCGRILIATANPELASVLGSLAAEGVHLTLLSFDDPTVAPLRAAATEFVPIDESLLMPLPPR